MLFTQLFESDFNKKPVAEAIDDDYEDCSYCSGTGEGRWEGSTCTHCQGSGVEPASSSEEDFDEPDSDVADMDNDEESYYEKSLRSRGLGEQGVAEGQGDGYYYLQGGIERSKKFASEAEAMAHSKRFFQLARVRRVTLKYKEPGQPAVVVKEFTFNDPEPPKSQMSWGDFYLQNKKQGMSEADKKKENEPETRDVALQRAITRAKADFPTAGSGLEALAKDFMRSQDQDQKSFDQIRQAERKQDQMLQQISQIDQEQEQEIQGLEQQNSTLASRLQQLQSVNSELEKKLAAMAGRKAEKKSKTDSAPAVVPSATTEPITPVAKKATKPKAKTQPAEPSNRLVTKQLTAPTSGARAFSSMTPALAAAGNPQQSLFPSDYAQDTANWAFQKFKKNAQDIPFRDVKKVSPELRNLAQQELEPTTENNEQKPERPEADYGPEYQDMVARVRKLAGQGPRKTVWDPVKRVYKTVPVNPQSK